jgi:putative ABC transport system permease protein
VAVGSDVAVDLAVPADGLSIPESTGVMLLPDVHLLPGGAEADVVGIDRETFEDGAFWDGSFGMSVDRFLAAVKPSGEALRAVVVRSGADVKEVSVAAATLPVSVAGRLDAFPGTARTRTLVVVDRDALQAALTAAGVSAGQAPPTFVLWAHGDPAEIRRRIEAAGRSIDAVRSVDEVRETPAFQSLAWTFGFLEALGVAAGVIALVGLVLYLQTRQRAREISYALARRMGLTRGAHRRSVAIELAGMLVTAFLVGAGLAFAAALLVYKRFDPLPSLPPGAVLRIPVVALAAAGGAIVLAAWVGSRLVQRRADRANVAEVMRAA